MTEKRNTYIGYADDQLLLLLRSDDEAAFAVLYDRYWDRVFYLAVQRLQVPGQAEDVVQDVFTDIWKRRRELDIRERFDTYLAVAVKYRIINLQARLNRMAAYEKNIKHTAIPEEETAEWLEFKELKTRLETHIAALPEKARIVFQYKQELGLRHKEIARILNISEKAVERSIARAVRLLKTSFKQFLGFLIV